MKFLYQPISPYEVTQHFGEDTVCYKQVGNYREYRHKATHASCPEGFKSVYSRMDGHNGLDYRAVYRQPVYASANGRVIEVSTEVDRGLGVGILSQVYNEEERRYRYFKHRYWHFSALEVEMGEQVKIGQMIGRAGSTGYSTGVHLHFELKETDQHGNTINHDNGYFGAIDPTPFLYDKSAESISLVRRLLSKGIINLVDALRWIQKL
jgi:murein DD-endopeptidase MepM/ murein hydrolase activator NlpD